MEVVEAEVEQRAPVDMEAEEVVEAQRPLLASRLLISAQRRQLLLVQVGQWGQEVARLMVLMEAQEGIPPLERT